MRHEVHLLRRGLVATVPFVLLLLLAAGTLRGRQAAASVAVGAGVILVNQLLSVASTAWARVFGPAAAATAYAGWV
ncbi:MAG TPA: hypothetical protein VM840_05085, partial [Actinomycetota bacterium]|nr:hypothetical protein [Actinomycetota bacterium]